MNSREQASEPTELSIEERLKKFSRIDDMPEATYEEVHTKWNACNNAVYTIGEFAPQLHSESGSNSLDDQGTEQAEDTREQEMAGAMMGHLRSEMVRLGDALEKLQAQKAA